MAKKVIPIPAPKKPQVMKFRVNIMGQNRTFNSQEEGIDWAKKCLEAGIFYMELKEVKE